MAALQPKKRPDSPEEIGDPEKGFSTFVPEPKKDKIEVVVDKTLPSKTKEEVTGDAILQKAIGPGYFRTAGKKKTRKQKRRAQKKTQKRRGRK